MRYTILIMLSLAIAACKNDTDDEAVDVGYSYFPTQVGATWIYTVDSITYDDNTGHTTIDTISYQYKEQITGTFVDGAGNTAQLVSRFYRDHDTLLWTRVTNSTVYQTALNAQRVNENIRYVKLVFPLEKSKSWNGNGFNELGEEMYTVTQYDEPNTIAGVPYTQTVRVLQKDELNFVKEIKREEVYARNIGLVYLLSDSIDTQVSGSRGFRYRLTLKTYKP